MTALTSTNFENKRKKIDVAWMWFTRLNIVIMPITAYLLFSWMQVDASFQNAPVFFQLTVIMAILAILFMIHYTSIFPFILGFFMIINGLLGSVDMSEPSLIVMIVLELSMGTISAPLVYFHVKYLLPEEDQKEDASISKERMSDQDDATIDEKESNKLGKLLEEVMVGELVIFGILGMVTGIIFYFALSSYLQPLRHAIQGIWSLVITGFIVIGVILAVGYPITIASRYTPEGIIRKILNKELPPDLVILLGTFLFLGTTVFFASLAGTMAFSTSLAVSLSMISENWTLFLILAWSLIFFGGTIITWVKRFFVSPKLLVDLSTLQLLTVLPMVLGLYITAELLSS